jgi:hypothetical protein
MDGRARKPERDVEVVETLVCDYGRRAILLLIEIDAKFRPAPSPFGSLSVLCRSGATIGCIEHARLH